MKIILDECVDRRLAREFIGYEVSTVPKMGWAGIKNGQLLARVSGAFDVFITVDRNLSFEQNLSQFDVAIIVLQARSNRLADLKALVPNTLEILAEAPKGAATLVDLG
ncbi:DUF5615 family PIN-like protein [Nodosilinea sp. PGN35]|uniref:DUF5615 family PIN-like protein n=1 Tax=Nodosilinea sp. PGN35 TaxID=3020489 RepID=UPI0023B2F754|nr:DUF5615 family PIN-like protein [Nodosilinea sp. TSF1-S3]MDF0369179.1 hypothetical protein [Nodosilinea sp. TSF1-S3]